MEYLIIVEPAVLFPMILRASRFNDELWQHLKCREAWIALGPGMAALSLTSEAVHERCSRISPRRSSRSDGRGLMAGTSGENKAENHEGFGGQATGTVQSSPQQR